MAEEDIEGDSWAATRRVNYAGGGFQACLAKNAQAYSVVDEPAAGAAARSGHVQDRTLQVGTPRNRRAFQDADTCIVDPRPSDSRGRMCNSIRDGGRRWVLRHWGARILDQRMHNPGHTWMQGNTTKVYSVTAE